MYNVYVLTQSEATTTPRPQGISTTKQRKM
jgi:hypothetical protein